MPAVPGRDRRDRQIQINPRLGTDPWRLELNARRFLRGERQGGPRSSASHNARPGPLPCLSASKRWRISKRSGKAKRGFLRCWQRGRIRLGRSPSRGSVQVQKCGSPKIDCQPVGPCRSSQSNSTPSILVHALSLANQTRMYLLG